jgi:hypothetical protein
MALTRSKPASIFTPEGNSLAVFIDVADGTLKLKDVFGGVELFSNFISGGGSGLKLKDDVLMTSTLTEVADKDNTPSVLRISTTDVTNYGGGAITSNTAFGSDALIANTTGNANIAIGQNALLSNLTAGSNTVVGVASMRINTTGSSNTALGAESLRFNVNGNNNTAIGRNAIFDVQTGSDNTAIGYNTGRGITTGSNNTILGANVTGLSPTLANNIIIADGSGNRRINVDSNGNVGIGTNTPLYNLDVVETSGSLNAVFTNSDATSNITFYQDNDQAKGLRLQSYGSTASGTLLDGTINRANSTVYRTNDASNPMVFGGFATSSEQVYFGKNSFTLALNNTTNNVTIGASSGTARLFIKGSGTTSATTSLLVQNSAGTELFKIADNGLTTTRSTLFFALSNAIMDGEGWYRTASNQFVNMLGDGGGSSGVRATGSTYGSGASQVQIKGNTSISGGFNQATARLQIVGSGTTQATTSLLVQNSASTNLLSVLDNGNVGIGTNAPTAKTHIVGIDQLSTSTSLLVQDSIGTNILRVHNQANNSAVVMSTAKIANYEIISGDVLFNTSMRFIPTTGGVAINKDYSSTAASTLVHLKGSGTTSATTSLLVQNSAGTQTFKVLDNGTIFMGIGSGSSFICDAGGPDKIRTSSVGVAIDGSPVTSAALAVNGTTKGFLPPRMTTTQKNAISNPAAGLMVYDTNLNKLCVYTTAWEIITSA